ncbi:DNA repair protein RecO [Patescibacteria group bacterium]
MSYHIYSSEGVILKATGVGEADKIYSIFTSVFGKIGIKAQGVRYLKSKLRYGLSGLSLVNVAFVGTLNGFWRLVDVEEILVFKNIKKSRLKTRSALKIFSLVDRLVQGEEADPDLFDKLKVFLFFLENNDLSQEKLKDLGISTAVQIVEHLGYADKETKDQNPVLVIKNALEQSML